MIRKDLKDKQVFFYPGLGIVQVRQGIHTDVSQRFQDVGAFLLREDPPGLQLPFQASGLPSQPSSLPGIPDSQNPSDEKKVKLAVFNAALLDRGNANQKRYEYTVSKPFVLISENVFRKKAVEKPDQAALKEALETAKPGAVHAFESIEDAYEAALGLIDSTKIQDVARVIAISRQYPGEEALVELREQALDILATVSTYFKFNALPKAAVIDKDAVMFFAPERAKLVEQLVSAFEAKAPKPKAAQALQDEGDLKDRVFRHFFNLHSDGIIDDQVFGVLKVLLEKDNLVIHKKACRRAKPTLKRAWTRKQHDDPEVNAEAERIFGEW